ncbi:MAG TPA: AarF/ABC1/UbiB kinase family protein [Thermaerobacter sp.]
MRRAARYEHLRHLRRYREIASVLARHGLTVVAEQLGLARRPGARGRAPEEVELAGEGAGARERNLGVHLRQALEELGPTFVKLGQLLSTRPDLLPPDVLRELSRLQDRVPPFPFEQVVAQIERELGRPLPELFARFDPQPLAAASIGQVHAAELPGGQPVVVKVQRPDARHTIEADLEILMGLAALAERYSTLAEVYPFREIAAEMAATLRAELDFVQEARNAERLWRLAARNPAVRIPRVYWEYTTPRVLTLERLEGTKLSEDAASALPPAECRRVGRALVLAVLEPMFTEGIFHADPHPGNVMLLRDGRIGLLDFGVVGRLDPTTRRHLTALVINLLRADTDGLVRNVVALADVPPDVDRRRLRRDLELLYDRYYEARFRDVDLAEVIPSFFEVLRRHRVRVPAELGLVGKTLLTLQGVASRLDPGLSVLELARPLALRLLRRYLSPAEAGRRLLDRWEEYGEPLLDLPAQLHRLVLDARAGRPLFKVEVVERDELHHGLSRLVNRLAFSVLLLSFTIMMSALVVAGALLGRSEPVLGFPFVEIGVALLAVATAALLWAIVRSGRL